MFLYYSIQKIFARPSLFLYYHVTGDQEGKGNISTEKFSYFPKLGNSLNSFLTFFLIFLSAVKPTKHEVLMKLACISASWHDIGNSLKLRHNDLKGLAQSYSSNNTRLGEVIQLWLDMNGQDGGAPVTWSTILNVLEGPLVNNKALAMEIYHSLKEESCNRQTLPSNYTIDSCC